MTRALVPAVVLLAAALAPYGAARAAASTPTCQGVPATVVGHRGATVHGTSGADVVVTAGATRVVSGNGNDLVCVTSVPDDSSVVVQVGAGDDTVVVMSGVVTSNSQPGLDYESGDGSDTFVGSGEEDDVHVQAGGHDRISTGGRDDVVEVDPGSGPADADVDLGVDDDLVQLDVPSNVGALLGGDGADALYPQQGSTRPWTWDAATGTAAAAGQLRFRFGGFEAYVLSDQPTPALTFLGSSADESVSDSGGVVTRQSGTYDMGDGNDTIRVSQEQSEVVDGGAGHDHLLLARYAQSVRGVGVDLSSGTIRYDLAVGSGSGTVTGVEDVNASRFPSTALTGDDGPNHLVADRPCHATIDGLGGSDSIHVGQRFCGAGSVLDGGDGNDLLIGSRYADQIDGGAGHDRADGRGGRDSCHAEVVVRC